jgi:hypothetical protein
MPNVLAAFTRHPASVGETYVEHFRFASRFGLRMISAGLACLLHGLLPFLFTRTGSSAVLDLHSRMTGGRAAVPPGGLPEPDYLI